MMRLKNKTHNFIHNTQAVDKTSNVFNPLKYSSMSNISFSASVEKDIVTLSNRQKLLINIQKPFAYLMGRVYAAQNYNLAALEGIQKGIKVFDGLSLKEISFIGHNLSFICATQGCYSKCSHCYADAQKPIKEKDDYIKNMAFEDFSSLVNGFKELKRRTGLDFIEKNQNTEYIALVFDADDMSVSLTDKNGCEHSFPELGRLIHDATGRRVIFDTSGWNIKSKKMQDRADKIVEYYSKDEKLDELYQFNVSINTFHSIYQKSIELKRNGYDKKADALYNIYVDRMANALLTFSSIIDKPNFGVIARAVDYDNEYIDDTALARILTDVEKVFKNKCIEDFSTEKKYIKTKERLVDLLQNTALNYKIIDTDILLGKRFAETMDKFPMKNSKYNIHVPYAEKLDAANYCYLLVKDKKSLKSSQRVYGKIIDVTGKVYLTDDYRVIPTDLQLNFINKNKKNDAFHSLVDDFIFTRDMI